MNLTANTTHLILTLLIPLAVAIVTKSTASARVKALVTIVLSAVVSLITASRLPNGTAVLSYQMAYDTVITTAIAVASYLGFWKPTVAVNDQAVVLPKVGLG